MCKEARLSHFARYLHQVLTRVTISWQFEWSRGAHRLNTVKDSVPELPAAYFASVRANELSRIFFPMPSLVSTIFFRICLNL